MPDDLRARIAAALLKEDQLRVCKLSDADIRFMTDAVIAELGLRIQVAGPDGIVGTGDYRYVTEWETDD